MYFLHLSSHILHLPPLSFPSSPPPPSSLQSYQAAVLAMRLWTSSILPSEGQQPSSLFLPPSQPGEPLQGEREDELEEEEERVERGGWSRRERRDWGEEIGRSTVTGVRKQVLSVD